ncbi:MAG TPA: hypothetical protein PK079_22070 [Leptospiraceae bacterium]|nr:hypothetical protein [Leptospiraceae bacterium]HMX33109.1 hypothetical protein [Leptospiraceae bacterium]HMY33111.1 hypothetical protein [Leptospiraceae bacterium]HMZ64236.1 hypothetical protein [Leptospiraceae bacterium]HNA09827.1 hypothetical protein [Leptospiraceae bacterium]
MKKTILVILSCLFLKNCLNKQLYEKTSLPRNKDFILVSGKIDPENYNDKMEVFIVTPENKKVELLDLLDETQISSLNYFKYREYLIFENGKKIKLRNKEGNLDYPQNTILYQLPILNDKKDKILYSDLSSIKVFDLNGKKKKEIKIEHERAEWFKDDKVAFLSDRKDKPGQSIQTIDLSSNKEETLYKSKQFISSFILSPDRTKLATIELDKVWNPIQYSVRIIDLTSGKILIQKNMPDYTKDIKWSTNGELGILFRMKAEEGLYPPFSIYLLSEKTDKDLLQLKAYEPPGFIFSGEGYSGVEEFTWSPDGSKIAYIASEPGNCNRDEGGNVHCDLDIYIVDINTGAKEKITNIKNKSFTFLFWKDRI